MRLRADAGAPFLDRGSETCSLELAHAVRRDIDTGAHLAQRRSLLVHGDFEPMRDQGIGGEQAADAAADDHDLGSRFFHLL
jgi:hypothetical protein